MNIDIGRIFSSTIDSIKAYPIILAPQIVLGLISFGLSMALFGATLTMTGSNINLGTLVAALIIYVIVLALVGVVTFSLTVCMAADVVENGSTSLASGISRFTSNLGSLLIAGILSGIIIGIGTVLCVLPGLVAAFFLMFVFAAVVLSNMGPTEAMQASFATVKDNVVDALVLMAIIFGLSLAGSLVSSILGFIPILGGLVGAVIIALIYAFSLLLTVEVYNDLTATPTPAA
ncbi:MAG: hypothetical protein ACYCXF_00180 [Thermoleophilia bacterium]